MDILKIVPMLLTSFCARLYSSYAPALTHANKGAEYSKVLSSQKASIKTPT